MNLKGSIFLLLTLSVFQLQAQRRSLQNKSTTIQPNTKSTTTQKTKTTSQSIPKPIPTKLDAGYWSVGLNAHTNAGFIGGFSFKKAWGLDEKKLSFIGVDLIKTEDYREFTLLDAGSNISIKDGKINSLFTIRPSFGKEYTLLKKGPDGGTQLKGILATGPSIGLLSPYYVNVTSKASGYSLIEPIKMLDFYNNKSAVTQYIVGEASTFKGLTESIVQPGWHGKAGLLLEFSSLKRNYIAIELGFVADTFFKPVSLMLQNPTRNTFSSAYLTFYLGKR